MVMPIRYISENEVAEITGRAVGTLRNDRYYHRGLPYVKLGRSVKYKLEDVIAYMDERTVLPN